MGLFVVVLLVVVVGVVVRRVVVVVVVVDVVDEVVEVVDDGQCEDEDAANDVPGDSCKKGQSGKHYAKILDQGRSAANHSPLPVPIPFPFPFHAKNQFFISPLNLH